MNSQDANINLIIDIDGKNVKGLLKMQHNNGNVSLSFFKEIEQDPNQRPVRTQKKYSQIPERVNQLSDFTKIEMNPDDPLALTLSGSRPNQFKLTFLQEQGITSFFDYIGQKVHLRHSDCNPCVFLLESLDSTQQTITPFMATVLPTPSCGSSITQNRISLPDIKKDAKELVFDFTQESDCSMSKEQYDELFEADGKIKESVKISDVFFNRNVDISRAGELWKILLNPDLAKMTREERAVKDKENLEVYEKVKKQWCLTSRKQWNNHVELRKLVALIEKDINENSKLFPVENKGAKIIAFNVLLTLSYYNWDHALYTKGLIKFLIPFLEPFVKDFNKEGTRVITHDDKEIDIVEAESSIFWCFFQFYDRNKLFDMVRPTKTPIVKKLFKDVGETLKEKYSCLLELLIQKHAFSLDFLRDDCNSLFSTCFGSVEIRQLWVSLLTHGNSEDFLKVFIISLLFYLAPKFVEMNPLNSEEFVRRFNELKHDINLSILLSNAKLLMDEPEPKNEE